MRSKPPVMNNLITTPLDRQRQPLFRHTSTRGLTLPELLIATTVVLLTSMGILYTYIQCLELNKINHDTTLVLQDCRNIMEDIRTASPSMVHETYHNKTFPLNGPTGIILVHVNDQDPQLLLVTVKAFWRQSKGRLIGEDKNLSGTLEEDEDTNKNNELDSPVTLMTYVYNR